MDAHATCKAGREIRAALPFAGHGRLSDDPSSRAMAAVCRIQNIDFNGQFVFLAGQLVHWGHRQRDLPIPLRTDRPGFSIAAAGIGPSLPAPAKKTVANRLRQNQTSCGEGKPDAFISLRPVQAPCRTGGATRSACRSQPTAESRAMALCDPSRERSPKMARRFKVGDHVRWNSEAGRVSGTIIAVHASDFDYKGHTHRATADDPQYEIKSDKTDHIAAHKGSALDLA
jgi:hypothetical protein